MRGKKTVALLLSADIKIPSQLVSCRPTGPLFALWCLRATACRSNRQFGETLPGLNQCRLLGGLPHVETFSVDELDIRDAQESEEIAHVAGLAIQRRTDIHSAPGGKDISLLAG